MVLSLWVLSTPSAESMVGQFVLSWGGVNEAAGGPKCRQVRQTGQVSDELTGRQGLGNRRLRAKPKGENITRMN